MPLNQIFSVLMFYVIFDISLAQIQCNKNSERRIDGTVSRILTIGNSGRRFPENENEMVPYCK